MLPLACVTLRTLMNRRLLTVALLVCVFLTICTSSWCQAPTSLKFDIGAVDKSADPCADFYQYACGNWMAQHPIPSDRPYIAVFQQMRELNEARIKGILEKAAQPSPTRTS